MKDLKDRLGLTYLLQPGIPVILLAEGSRQAQAAVSQLQESVFLVVGVVEDSMMAWCGNDLTVKDLPEVSVQGNRQGSPDRDTLVLDVWKPIEWAMGHMPGGTPAEGAS